MKTDLYKLLSQAAALEDNTGPIKQPRGCSVVVKFKNCQHIEKVLSVFAMHEPQLERYGNYLIALKESYEAAQITAGNLNSIHLRFKETLIAQPFESGWLDTYTQIADLGINVIMVSKELGIAEEIPAWIEESERRRLKNRDYEDAIDELNSLCLKFGKVHFASAWSLYMSEYWLGADPEEYSEFVSAAYDLMDKATKGSDFLSAHPVQSLRYALKQKAEYLVQSQGGETREAVLERFEVERNFQKRIDASRNRETWIALQKLVFDLIQEKLPLIRPVLKLDKEVVELDHTKLAFYNMKHTDCDLDLRISPKNLIHSQEDHGISYLDSLTGTMAAYFLTAMEHKQEERLKLGLIEHSKVMNEKPLYNHLLVILDNSRPLG